MKAMKWIPFLILYLLGTSCEEEVPYPNHGEARALRNGKFWKATLIYTLEDNRYNTQDSNVRYSYTLHADLDKYRIEKMSFSRYPLEVGRYPVWFFESKTSGSYTTFIGTHTPDDRMPVWESEGDARNPITPPNPLPNYFEITSIEGNEVKGKFQVTFVRDPDRPHRNPNLEDTVRFTEGEFTVRLPEE